MKFTAILNISAIGLLNLAPPAFARELTFQETYQFYMTEGRAGTLTMCDQGRQFNTRGVSYWNNQIVETRRKTMLNGGIPKTVISNHSSGSALAMNQLCPDVW